MRRSPHRSPVLEGEPTDQPPWRVAAQRHGSGVKTATGPRVPSWRTRRGRATAGTARRFTVLLGIVALVAASCGGGGDDGKAGEKAVTITIWSGYTDRELGVLQKSLDRFHEKYPKITVKSVGGQGDDRITSAIRGGDPPDVALSLDASFLGPYCTSGGLTDLGDRIKEDKLDLSVMPKVSLFYTQLDGKRCALPMLADAYGLYYRKDLLAAAGFDAPPKTLSELADMAKKLTTRKPDGSIDVAGFVPLFGFYEHVASRYGPATGAEWFDDDGKSALASDPGWAKALKWQKQLVDDIGRDDLKKFVAGAGDEFSPQNMFETGKIAMMVDGEWRLAFLEEEAPELDVGTAPYPVDDDQPELYGGGYTIGNYIGIPKGADHADEAWLLVKFLATDTDNMVELANELKNVPTTKDALESPDFEYDEKFKVFLDVVNDPHSSVAPPTAAGAAMEDAFQTFLDKWQDGSVKDLDKGLTDTAEEIDELLAQQSTGGPP